MRVTSCLIHMLFGTVLSTNTACSGVNSRPLSTGRVDSVSNVSKAGGQTLVIQSRRLNRTAGWQIPGLSQSKEFKPRRLLDHVSNEAVKVYGTWLRPDHKVVLDDDYLSEDDLQELRVIGGRTIASDIIRYDIDDRPFCYVIHIHPEGLGATQQLVYYDEDGDGVFEVIESGRWQQTPRIPQWATGEN